MQREAEPPVTQRKLRLFAFLYVGGIVLLAVIQLLFHVRL
jgi:hypothetical protein